MPKALKLLLLFCGWAAFLFGQGLSTTASRDDWEEINFELDSAVLTDGFPSLVRLAELLKQNPAYRVKLEGHTDWLASDRYNERLSSARAEEVKKYLVKYGARPEQITTVGYGERSPKVSNQTKEGRFMNRRVVITVTDAQGNVISAGGVGEAISAIQAAERKALEKAAQCCDEALKRLERLNEISGQLKDLKAENEKLRQEMAALGQAQAAAQKQVAELPKPPERAELAQMMEATAEKAIEKARPSRFALLGLNVGPTLNETFRREIFGGRRDIGDWGRGNITLTGKGRYFAPFGKTEMHALQAEGEYLYYRDRQEGQFDLGLVNRFRSFQAGLFSSIKHVNLTDLGGGTLGQGALTLDYVFSRGRAGAFGTKGYLDNRVINRTPFSPSGNIILESYLKIVDQVGASTQVGVWRDAYVDANFGALFRRGGTNRPGGMFRLVQPIDESWAFTVEAGLNETMVGPKNTGRIVFGIQFGSWLRPKQFTQVRHPVPVEVPRLRYELLTRTVRIGNAAPVADAGPDQIGVGAGRITLDGSASYDLDGDELTYQWDQIGGPSVSLSGQTGKVATFTAAEGQTYSFRLTVRDTQGAQATDKVTVTTAAPLRVRIIRFAANPASIRAGQTTTLVWEIENAESAEITGLGQVDPSAGTSTVAPVETTEYRLTARNRTGEVSETITVTVERPQVRIVSFQASPASIAAGESSMLSWQTENADEVTISGIGPVAATGSTRVSPAETATYTLTARNRFGEASATAAVQVTPGAPPRIVRFTAAPAEILSGEKSTLLWQVENATEISISGIGPVEATGTREAGPTATTTYTLTARNRFGEATATATVTVIPRVAILSFTASPTTVAAGSAVTLSWTTQNATSASISGVGPVETSGSVVVRPAQTATYTLTAIGNRSQATAQFTVQVTGPAPGRDPTCSAGPNQTTASQTVRLDASRSQDPNGRPLSFSWRVAGTRQADISGANTATPAVTLLAGFGEYIFEVAVTNDAGGRCTATTTVNLIDP